MSTGSYYKGLIMAEIWGAAIGVAGSVISGVAASKQAKKDRKNKVTDTKEGAALERENMAFAASLDDYYSQKKRAGMQRGLDEFRKFSTLGNFAPGYQDTSQRIVVPDSAPAPRAVDTVPVSATNRPAVSADYSDRGIAGRMTMTP